MGDRYSEFAQYYEQVRKELEAAIEEYNSAASDDAREAAQVKIEVCKLNIKSLGDATKVLPNFDWFK